MRFRLVATCVAVLALVMLTAPRGRGQELCFNPAANFTTGDRPFSIHAADLDRDGDQDLAVANYGSDNASVLKNNGDGTFAAPMNYPVADGPVSVFAADLDGDDDADLVVANIWGDNVSVLKNNGDGTYEAAVNYGAGDGSYSVFASDLDGDNDADLAVANASSDNISILKNNGDGTFEAAVNYAAGDGPYSIYAADLDGDDDADLAVANFYGGNVSILKNNGDGTFEAAASYATGDRSNSVFVADLDGDNDADLAVANASGDNISILRNNGDGTFTAAVNYAAWDGPTSVVATDLDGDHDADLALATSHSNDVTVLKNNGDGTYGAGVKYATGNYPISVFAADLDGDGHADLTLANYNVGNVSVLMNCLEGDKPPTAICQNVAKSADANCQAAVTPAEVDSGSYDPDPGETITLQLVPPGPFNKGATPVILIVTDPIGLADTCSATVTVNDVTPPVISCPANIIRGNDLGQCGATVTFTATATDNCPGATVSSYIPPSGSFLPVGLTQVRSIATDASGNRDTCFFNVTVNDTEPPVATCPGEITVGIPLGQIGAVVGFASAATDNCPGSTASCSPASGSSFPLGVTVVTCIASDQAGNKDTCEFAVTVTLQCACDCHADPANCDHVQDVLDVVQTINVAFRGQSAIPDPNGNCPYQTTDVDCSGDTSVLDVVHMINVAFRGANAATEFCAPCP